MAKNSHASQKKLAAAAHFFRLSGPVAGNDRLDDYLSHPRCYYARSQVRRCFGGDHRVGVGDLVFGGARMGAELAIFRRRA